jgi:two-component system sensor histidine kinase AlgZ
MHPILDRRGRLGLYLLAWLPLLPLVAGLLFLLGGAAWGEAFALALPPLVVYAYLCLAAWYVCRALPLKTAEPLALLITHGLSAVLSAGLWVLLGEGWAWSLAQLGAFPAAAAPYARSMPALFGLGVPLYLVAVVLHYLLLTVEESRAAESRALEDRVLAREAELRALKAQLDPHFLFNSLNAVAALAGSDPGAARKMAILLSEFLRRSLRLGGRAAIPLGEELAHAASYLAIERVRFGDRLTVEEEIEEASRACLVPPLVLQPLVENAVRHGVAELLEGGVIRIEARVVDGRLALAVENPCDALHPVGPPVPRGGVGAGGTGGVGLRNVAAQLAARYGEAGRLAVTAPPGRFRVELTLPAETASEGRIEGRIDGV